MAINKLLLISEIAKFEPGIKHIHSGMIMLFQAVFQSHSECWFTSLQGDTYIPQLAYSINFQFKWSKGRDNLEGAGVHWRIILK